MFVNNTGKPGVYSDKCANRGLFSDEANLEAKEKMRDPLYIFDTKGVNKKFVGYESTQTLYSLSIPPTNESKTVSRNKITELLNKSHDEITMKFIMKDLGLGEFPNKKQDCNINDKVILKPGDYKGIDEKTETTVGKLLINKVLFEPVDYEYQNETFTKDRTEYHLNYLGSKVLNKDLDIDEYKKLLNRFEDFSMRMSSFASPSVYLDMMDLDPEIKELREKLIEENREAIENGDTKVISEIEEELLEKVKEVYADNPQMQLFLSGGKPYMDNSYKKSSIMVGAVPADLNASEFHISTNNYVDGLDKSDIHKVSGSMILGAYFRGLNKAV